MKTFWSPDMHWQIQISTRRYDKRGTKKHSANARVNSVTKWIEGSCDIVCLYFIILFQESEQWWGFQGYSSLFMSLQST